MRPTGPGTERASIDSLSSLGTRWVKCDPRGRARNCNKCVTGVSLSISHSDGHHVLSPACGLGFCR